MKKVILMNSSTMPLEGTYTFQRITQEEFVSEIKAADEIESYIGYVVITDIIYELTGIRVQKNRKSTILDPTASILVIKLDHRYPSTYKKKPVNDKHSYMFGRITFKPHIKT